MPILEKFKKSLKWFFIIYQIFLAKFALAAIKTGLEETGKEAFGEGNIPTKELPELIGQIIGDILILVGTIFFVLMLYGGFTWMKARGNEKEIEKAKNTLTEAFIGIIVVAAAYAITRFILDILTK